MKNNVKRERGGNPEKKERSVADLFAIFKRNHRARGHTSESRGAEPKVCSVHRQVGPRCEYIFGCVGMKIFSNQIHEESHPLRVSSHVRRCSCRGELPDDGLDAKAECLNYASPLGKGTRAMLTSRGEGSFTRATTDDGTGDGCACGWGCEGSPASSISITAAAAAAGVAAGCLERCVGSSSPASRQLGWQARSPPQTP